MARSDSPALERLHRDRPRILPRLATAIVVCLSVTGGAIPSPALADVARLDRSGVEDPCDGYDNDGNGTPDDGCDTVCDAPEKWGGDVRVTDSPWASHPSLAFTGTGYGVAWIDERDGTAEIYFARIDLAGAKVGSDVRLTLGFANFSEPSLVWTGDQFGVAWTDHRDGNNEIYLARLDASGNKLGADVRVTNDPAGSGTPDLIWTGSEFAVVWTDGRSGFGEIYFARLDAAGNKLGSDVRVTNVFPGAQQASLTWNGSDYGVVWSDMRHGPAEIYFARLDTSGTKMGPDVRVTTTAAGSMHPCVVWTGTKYGVIWQAVGDVDFDVYFARLGSSGNKIGGDVQVSDGTERATYPQLVWSGSEYGVSWVDGSDNGASRVQFARLGTSGGMIGSRVEAVGPYAWEGDLSLVWTGSNYALAWHDGREVIEIYFARLRCCDDVDTDGHTECAGDGNDADPSIYPGALEVCDGKDNNCDGSIDEVCDGSCDDPGTWGTERRVTHEASWSGDPCLAWTGDGYGLSWVDGRDTGAEIYFARLDSTGGEIGDDVRLTEDPLLSQASSVVWTGTEYGVIWRDNRVDLDAEVYFTRVDGSGNEIGDDVLVTASNGTVSNDPSMVWTGSEYGAAWNDFREGNDEIFFVRLDASGNKVGGAIRVTDDPARSAEPSLAWTGGGYGVVWMDNRLGNHEIYFAPLDLTGARIGDDLRVTDDAAASLHPSLVWSGAGYGVAWEDDRSGNFEIYFARLDASGFRIGDDLRVTHDAAVSSDAHLAWTGWEYGVTWHDERDGNREIYFARIDAAGGAIGGAVRLTDDPARSYHPDLDWNGREYGLSWKENRDGNDEIYFARLRCCDDLDGDDQNECYDCVDTDATVHHGAPQLCDGIHNDCSAGDWPAVPLDEVDNDGDCSVECEPWVGAGDVPCGGGPRGRQPYVVGGGDCDDDDATTYPGAPEVNDGKDNQCPGDLGYDLADETSGTSGFFNPDDRREYSWPAQSGATLYEVARSTLRSFADGCTVWTMADTRVSDAEDPDPPAGIFHYLNRPVAPNAGSWGPATVPRDGVCP